MDADDPLSVLLIDATEVDKKRIAEALTGIVGIDSGASGRVVTTPDFKKLAAPQKVLAFLLGRKVAVLMGKASVEAMSPKDLASQAVIPEGTVRRTVRQLFDDRLVSQGDDGHYYLAEHQVGVAIDRLEARTGSNDEVVVAKKASSTKKAAAKRGAKKASASTTNEGSEGRSEKAPSQANPGGQSGTSRRRGTTSGFSPTEAVRAFIEQGFFDSPKTLADVQARLKDKQGRDVPQTTLSPIFTRLLRAEALDRDKREDGTYEYTVRS